MAKLLIIETDEVLCRKFQELLHAYTDFSFDIAQSYEEASLLLDRSRYEFAVAETDLFDAKRGQVIALLNRYNIAPVIFTARFDDSFQDAFESANIVDYVLKEHTESIVDVIEKLKNLQNNKKKTVLLVDNTTLFRSYLQQNLLIHNFCVLSAASEEEALKRLEIHSGIELMIINCHMPDLDTLKLIKQSRIKKAKKDLHIVVMTKETDSYNTSRFLREGANDYITKPFSRDEFYTRVYKNINSARLFESIHAELTQNIINLFSEITEFKNVESSSHLKRIGEYSYILAKLAGMFEGEAKMVGEMAILHDVGKMLIPNSILCKAEKLTSAEFQQMQQHTVMGKEFLKKAFWQNPKVGQTAIDISLYHHEKWNGTGYPEGLFGENIPLAARIVSLVDVFDALINERVYKKAWDMQEVLSYIEEHSGTQFDPTLTRLFLKNIDCFVNVLRKYGLDKSEEGYCPLTTD